jgi:hypothetical protein
MLIMLLMLNKNNEVKLCLVNMKPSISEMDDFIRMIQGSQWKEEHAKYFSIQEKSGI